MKKSGHSKLIIKKIQFTKEKKVDSKEIAKVKSIGFVEGLDIELRKREVPSMTLGFQLAHLDGSPM